MAGSSTDQTRFQVGQAHRRMEIPAPINQRRGPGPRNVCWVVPVLMFPTLARHVFVQTRLVSRRNAKAAPETKIASHTTTLTIQAQSNSPVMGLRASCPIP
jgi:hypothetical protein